MKEQKERFSKLERAFKILEYLKLNSDSEHTVTQAALRRESEIEPYLGDKETYNDTIVKMAMALNFDEYGVKSENEWKLIFKRFRQKNSGLNRLMKAIQKMNMTIIRQRESEGCIIIILSHMRKLTV